MRIRAFAVLLLLVPTLHHAADACGKLQPTLRAYYVQEYGEDYRKGIVTVPSPEEGATCEKIRYDLQYWSCQWQSYRSDRPRKHHIQTTAQGIPVAVQRIQSQKASKMGGEPVKQRSIERAWAYYRTKMKQLAEAEAGIASSKAGYLAAHSKFKAAGCKVGLFGRYGRDPIIDGDR